MNAYIINILILMCIYAILSGSLNFVLGYAGLINLGHVAFFAIGAYTSALLTKAGVPYVIALPLAGIFAAVFGYLLVLGTFRLKGDYLALATLGFSFVIGSILLNWQWLTRGPLGIPGIAKPELFGIVFKSGVMFLILSAVLCAITYLVLWRTTSSRYGLALQAVRDDEIASKVLGKNTFQLKWQALAIGAFFAGIAGSLFAHYITYIDPSSFALTEIILVLTIVIVGGLASLRGTLLATVIILAVPELLRFVDMPSSVLGPLRQMIYAAILLIILFVRPKGLFGKVDLA